MQINKEALTVINSQTVCVRWRDTHFEIVDVCEEEADEAEGNNPLAYSAGQVVGVVLKEGHMQGTIIFGQLSRVASFGIQTVN